MCWYLRCSQGVRFATTGRAEGIAIETAGLIGQPVGTAATHVILTCDDTSAQIRKVEGRRTITGAVGGPDGSEQVSVGGTRDFLPMANKPARGR